MYRSRSSVLAFVLVAACGGTQKPVATSCPVERTVIASQEDVDRIAACTTLGTLVVRSGAPLVLGSLRVEHVRGDVIIGPTINLEELRLPALREVDGALTIASNTLLRAVFLPALAQAQEISITANSAVVTLSLPALTTVRKTLAIEELPSLEVVDASSLATVGQALVIAGNPALELLWLPPRLHVGELRLSENRALPEETANELRARVSTTSAP